MPAEARVSRASRTTSPTESASLRHGRTIVTYSFVADASAGFPGCRSTASMLAGFIAANLLLTRFGDLFVWLRVIFVGWVVKPLFSCWPSWTFTFALSH